MIDSECKTLALLFRVAVCLVPSGDGRIAVCIRMGDCSRVYRLCNQPLGPTQPPTLSGMGNDYWSVGSGSALRLGR